MTQVKTTKYLCPRCGDEVFTVFGRSTLIKCAKCGGDVRLPLHAVRDGWALGGLGVGAVLGVIVLFALWLTGYINQWVPKFPQDWFAAVIAILLLAIVPGLVVGAVLWPVGILVVRDE